MKKLAFYWLFGHTFLWFGCATFSSQTGSNSSLSSTKKEQDRQAIKKMCGCFKVRFQFAETFNYSDNPKYKPSKIKEVGALEWAELVEDKKDTIVIQHLLVIDAGEEPFIQKHWRQDWLYENTDFYSYDGANVWRYFRKDKDTVRGQWTQKVYQVDDSPRYEGTGSWVKIDGKHYWESTAYAPLPRREYTKRIDYNITLRRNRHKLTKSGWIHEQDNDKILNKKGTKKRIAQEKGYNTYTKVPDSLCLAAQKYWKKNRKYWQKVRKGWAKVLTKNKDITTEK